MDVEIIKTLINKPLTLTVHLAGIRGYMQARGDDKQSMKTGIYLLVNLRSPRDVFVLSFLCLFVPLFASLQFAFGQLLR